jgi:hypothetical protein
MGKYLINRKNRVIFVLNGDSQVLNNGKPFASRSDAQAYVVSHKAAEVL